MAEQKLAGPTKPVVPTVSEVLPRHDPLPDRLALANERLENAVIFDPNQFTQLITQSIAAAVSPDTARRREQQLQGDTLLPFGGKQKKSRIGVRFDGETIRLLALAADAPNAEQAILALEPTASGLEIGRAELQRLVERILEDLKIQQLPPTLSTAAVTQAVERQLTDRFTGPGAKELAQIITERVERTLARGQTEDPPWILANVSEAEWHRLQPVAGRMAVEFVALSAAERAATIDALRAAQVPEVEQLLAVVRVEVLRLEKALPDIEAKAREDKRLEGFLREIAAAPDKTRTLSQLAHSVQGEGSSYGGLLSARLERTFHEREQRRVLEARAFDVYLSHAVEPNAIRWRSFQAEMSKEARAAGLGPAELYDQVERESRLLLRRVSEEILAGRSDAQERIVQELYSVNATVPREYTQKKVKAAFDLLPAILASPLLSGSDTQGLLQRIAKNLTPTSYRALLSSLEAGQLSSDQCAEVAPHLVGILNREGHLLSWAMKSALQSDHREVLTALVRKALTQDAPAKAYITLVREIAAVDGLALHATYAGVSDVLPSRVAAALPGASAETIGEVTSSLRRHLEALRVEDLLAAVGVDLALHPLAQSERVRSHIEVLRLEHPTLSLSLEDLTQRIEAERQRALHRLAGLSEREHIELRYALQTRAVQMTHMAGATESTIQTALALTTDLHHTPESLAPLLGSSTQIAALLQRTALADNQFDRDAARAELQRVTSPTENGAAAERIASFGLQELAEEFSRPTYAQLSPHYQTEALLKVRNAYHALGVRGAELERRTVLFAYGVQLRQAERIIEASEANAIRAGDHYLDPATKSPQIPVARKCDRWIQRGCRSADLPVYLREQYQLLGYTGEELDARVEAAVGRIDQAYDAQRRAAQAPVLARIRTLVDAGGVVALRFTGDDKIVEARPERTPRALSILRFELMRRLRPDWKKESGAEDGKPSDAKVQEILSKALTGNELLGILDNGVALERTLRVIDFQRASYVLGEGAVPYSDAVMRVLAGAVPEDESERLLLEAQAFEAFEYSFALMARKEAEAEEQTLREASAARWYAVGRVLGAPAKGLTFGLWDPANDGIRLNSWLRGNDARVTQYFVDRAEGLYGNLSGGWYWISHGAELVGEVGGSLVTMGGTAKLLSAPAKGLLQLTGRSAAAAEYGAFAISGGAYAAITAPTGQRAEAFWRSTALNLLAPGIASRLRRFMPRDGSRLLQHALSEGAGFASANVIVHGGNVSLPQLGYDALFGFLLGGVQGKVAGARAKAEAAREIEGSLRGASRAERQASASKNLEELKDKAYTLRQTLAKAGSETALEREALLKELRKVSDAISATRRVFWSAATVERMGFLLQPARLIGRGLNGVGRSITGAASVLTRSAEWCTGQAARLVRFAGSTTLSVGARGVEVLRVGGARLLNATQRVSRHLTERLEGISMPAANGVRRLGDTISGLSERVVAVTQGAQARLRGLLTSVQQWTAARWAAVQMVQAARTEARVFLLQASSREVRAWQQSLTHSEIPAAQAQISPGSPLAARAKVLGLQLQKLEASLHEEARGLARVADGWNYTRLWDLFLPRRGAVAHPRASIRPEAPVRGTGAEAPSPPLAQPQPSPRPVEQARRGPDEHTSLELQERHAKVQAEIGQREQYLKKVDEGLGKSPSDRVREMLQEEAQATKRALSELQSKLEAIEESIVYERGCRESPPSAPDGGGIGGKAGRPESGGSGGTNAQGDGGVALQTARRPSRSATKPRPLGDSEGGRARTQEASSGVALLDPPMAPRVESAARSVAPQTVPAREPRTGAMPSAPQAAPEARSIAAVSPLVRSLPQPVHAQVGGPTVVRLPTQSVMNHGDPARAEEARRRRRDLDWGVGGSEEEPIRKREDDSIRRREDDPRPKALRLREFHASSLRTLYGRRAKFIGEDIGATFYEQLEEAAGELFGDENQAAETNLFARRRFAIREDDDGRD